MFDSDNNNINYVIELGTNTWDTGIFQITEINNKRTILKNLRLNDFKNYDTTLKQNTLFFKNTFVFLMSEIRIDVEYEQPLLIKIISNFITFIRYLKKINKLYL